MSADSSMVVLRMRGTLCALDQRLPMFFGSQRAMKSVVAAEAAALAAWRALAGGGPGTALAAALHRVRREGRSVSAGDTQLPALNPH